MEIKITEKVISILPYISTSWNNVKTLHLEGEDLIFTLADDLKVSVPNLNDKDIAAIFKMHAKVVEKRSDSDLGKNAATQDGLFKMLSQTSKMFPIDGIEGRPFPVQFGISDGLDGVETMMQHNPAKADSPDLPPEIIKKIVKISKIISQDDEFIPPEPELNCNCFHCQIARAIHKGVEYIDINDDEDVSDEDLRFKEWDIFQESEKMYIVTNPFDKEENYKVFLGDTIGCTCGKKNCEHIRAVLQS